MEQLRSVKLRREIATARGVVVWIGKNHIRGSTCTDGRAILRAGSSVFEDVRQVCESIQDAKLPAQSPVLVISLFSPTKPEIVNEMNRGLQRLAHKFAAERTCKMCFLAMDDPAGIGGGTCLTAS